MQNNKYLAHSAACMMLLALGTSLAGPPPPRLLGIPGTDVTEPRMKMERVALKTELARGHYAALEERLQQAQTGYKMGRLSDVALRNLFEAFTEARDEFAPHYDQWVAAYPRSYPARLARGIYYRSMGEERRGENFIDKTPASNRAAMGTMFAHAFEDLQNSLALDDQPILSYLYLISVGKHVKPRKFLRRQYEASLRLDPRNFVVRRVYFRSLRPRWGGSIGAMYALLEQSRAAKLPAAQLSELEALLEEELGWIAERQERPDIAFRHYANAVRAFPQSNEDLWYDYARVAWKGRDCRTTLPIVTRLVAIADQLSTRNKAWAHEVRSYCLFSAERSDEAMRELRQAAELGSAWAQAELVQRKGM